MRFIRWAAVTTLGALLVVSGPAAGPASALIVPAPDIRYTSYLSGDGLTQPAIVPLFPTPAVNPGLVIGAAMGTVDYGGGTPTSYTANWRRCSPRNQATADCTIVRRSVSAAGANASGNWFIYTPTSEDVGAYLRFDISIQAQSAAGAALAPVVVSNAGSELFVVPIASAGGVQATGALVPGRATAVEAYVWNVPAGSTFVRRTITAYACARADAGQSPGLTFDSTGCTTISSGLQGDANSNGFSTISLLLPLTVGGKHLLFSESLTMRTNGLVTVYQRRSPTQQIGGSSSDVGPVPAPSASASAAPDGSSPADGSGGGGGGGESTPSPSTSSSSEQSTTTAQATALAAAAGVDVQRSPVAGTTGLGTVSGLTMRLTTPTIQPRAARHRLDARITPRQKGRVRFVLTRTGPRGAVAIGKVKTAAVRRGRAATSWVLEARKPVGSYVVIATFTPRRAGAPGITVTQAIRVT